MTSHWKASIHEQYILGECLLWRISFLEDTKTFSTLLKLPKTQKEKQTWIDAYSSRLFYVRDGSSYGWALKWACSGVEENIGLKNPPSEVVDRYPVEDHKKPRFPENSQYVGYQTLVQWWCCIPGDAKIAYVKKEKRRPYFFSFCFTLEWDCDIEMIGRDKSRSYGTSLFYYEKLSRRERLLFDCNG